MTKPITINHYTVKSLCKFITQSVTFEIKKRTVYDKALEKTRFCSWLSGLFGNVFHFTVLRD